MKLTWVKPPQQARSEETLQRYLDAAAQLLEKKSWEEVGVAELSRKAKASVGAFYARFEDKDGLLHTLHTGWCDEARANAAAALAVERWKGVSLDEMVFAMVRLSVEDYEVRAGFHREIVRRNSWDPKFRARSLDLAKGTIAHITALLEARKVADAPQAADMVHRLLFSVLDQHVQLFSAELPKAVAGAGGIRRRTSKELVDEISRAILGYLSWGKT